LQLRKSRETTSSQRSSHRFAASRWASVGEGCSGSRAVERLPWTKQQPCYCLSLSFGPDPAAPVEFPLVPGADSATIEGVPQQSQVALLAKCHWAGAGIGRIVVTFQPFGVFTKTWFMRNRVC